jgi:hypothetical protein
MLIIAFGQFSTLYQIMIENAYAYNEIIKVTSPIP